MEGRARFAAKALNYIKQLRSDIFQGILLEELSKRARIDLDELKQQVKQPDETHTPCPYCFTRCVSPKNQITDPLRVSLLRCLLQHPHLVELIEEPLRLAKCPGTPYYHSSLTEHTKKPKYNDRSTIGDTGEDRKKKICLPNSTHGNIWCQKLGLIMNFSEPFANSPY